jgi:nitrogen fixation-related uncharacterized protein
MAIRSLLNVLEVLADGPGAGSSHAGGAHTTPGLSLALWVSLGLLLVGFLALLFWSLARGDFRNVERPARRMLELEEEGGVKIDEHHE